ALPLPPLGSFYHSSDELLADLGVMEASLRANAGADVAAGALHDYIRRIEVFGLHTATLDIRQHRDRHESALAELLARAGVCADYAALSEQERVALLAREIADPRPLIPFSLSGDWGLATGDWETESGIRDAIPQRGSKIPNPKSQIQNPQSP